LGRSLCQIGGPENPSFVTQNSGFYNGIIGHKLPRGSPHSLLDPLNVVVAELLNQTAAQKDEFGIQKIEATAQVGSSKSAARSMMATMWGFPSLSPWEKNLLLMAFRSAPFSA